MINKHITNIGSGLSKSRRYLVKLLLVASATMPFAPAEAEEAGAWYQVEVIIFERLNQNRAGDAEIWPKDVNLTYPSQWQKMVPTAVAEEIVAAMTQEAGDVTEPDALSTAVSTERPLAPTEEELSPAPIDEPIPPVMTAGGKPQLAYVPLPASERTLNESAGGIARSRNMRVLFHEAWRQPIQSAEETPAIIVQGGNNYGEHTELEGSLQLSVSRYLHLHSHLWLTQFIPNYGQESDHWPPLPPVPQKEQPPSEQPQPQDLQVTGWTEQQSAWELETPLIDDYTNLINEPFLIKEIVVLQQNRRMRSGELHYVDHPRMGLLIKIDEYTPKEIEERKTDGTN